MADSRVKTAMACCTISSKNYLMTITLVLHGASILLFRMFCGRCATMQSLLQHLLTNINLCAATLEYTGSVRCSMACIPRSMCLSERKNLAR